MSDTPKTPSTDAAPKAEVVEKAPAVFSLEATYKQAEERMKALDASIATDERSIASARARIAAAREERKSLERLLASRTPRTRKAAR